MRRFLAVLLLVTLNALPSPSVSAEEDLAGYVDPFIGTFGSGFVFPGPAAPYGMVQLSPDTENYFAYTGYLWTDQFIRGFSHVHVQSMGVHTAGNIPFMPTTGPVTSTDPLRYMSRFDHATETASPAYYSALLHTYGVSAELTAGLRVGRHRYTFPPVPQANVILDVGRSVPRDDSDPARPGIHQASVGLAGPRTVTGSAQTRQGYTVHFAARFDRDVGGFASWDAAGQEPVAGKPSASGVGAGAYVTFDAIADPTVEIAVGISFVSTANAQLNLDAEDAPFDTLRRGTRAAWDDALRTIEVSGGTVADKRSFYTALYHAQHHPNVFTDSNGEYIGHDGAVHVADGYTHYANFSLWDTYRTQMPLLAVLQPERYRDMMHTILQIIGQSRMPQWALMNRLPDYMIGEPAILAIAQGFCQGLIPPGDEDALYEAMRDVALVRHRDPSYLQYGYVPLDVDGGGASITLEHAVADFALALVADATGRSADRDALLSLAGNYRNLVDPETKFVRPRKKDGSWMTPYHPELPDGFVEGNGWQYTWLVPHDPAGLIAMIGEDLAREKLDTFFALHPEVQKHMNVFGIAYYGNQYAPANEHDLQAPYFYNYADRPWKTQALIRANQALYRPTPDGLPGNDDLGTMSAWYIWSALGFYPMAAGAPMYTIGSPVFETARIHLPGGEFVVRAPGASAVAQYVGAATLDGAPLARSSFAGIAPGRELVLEMSPLPNTDLWRGPGGASPSASTSPLAAFGCAA